MLVDTSAWVELFIKSDKGKVVRDTLKKEKCYTSIVSISEISNWASKQNLYNKDLINIIVATTEIINLNLDISKLAGELNYKRKKKIERWGMLDSFILATSLLYNLKILTKDSHFKDLENVKIL